MNLRVFRQSIIILILASFPVFSFGQTKAIDTLQTQSRIPTGYLARVNIFVYNALRQISGAQATYQATAGNGNYAFTLQELTDLDFIDRTLGSGEKYGYYFTMSTTQQSPNSPAFFVLTATPRRYLKTGIRSYYLDSSGEIRGADKNGAPATVNDPVIIICGNNETEAIQTLHTIYGAEFTYQATAGIGDFGTLQTLYSIGLVDSSTATGSRCGYNFTLITTNRFETIPPNFHITAVPQQYPISGRRSFYVDETGIIRAADRNGEPADANDLPFQN